MTPGPATPPVLPAPAHARDLRLANLRNAPALTVLALTVGGLAYSAVVPAHWLRGVLIMASGMIIGGAFRLMLPTRQAGVLAVRGRLSDVLCYLGIGAVLWVVGLWLPMARG
ncbi:MAG: DUF3017 domain-containing protein [Actinobacteria bacterium]|nr:DUF3017 domain-containing protein [Actinomycetota bacterium]MBI3686140.1 DUF3017 domain-containing protein [Actinomycetota bacterium]